MVHKFKQDLGSDYHTILNLASDFNNINAYKAIGVETFSLARKVFIKYLNTDINLQSLHVFLDSYLKHHKSSDPLFTSNQSDVTKSYGYTDLVGEKFKDHPIK